MEKMLKMGVRVEQQALAKHGLDFVAKTYLPQKLKAAKDFLP
jgi:DNA topoisomerase VI subunit A